MAILTPLPVAYLWSSVVLKALSTGDCAVGSMSSVSPDVAHCAVCFMGTVGLGSPPSGTGAVMLDMSGFSTACARVGVVSRVVAVSVVSIFVTARMGVYFSRVCGVVCGFWCGCSCSYFSCVIGMRWVVFEFRY